MAAALELFVEDGYERTTVTEIAARAGVTERTFFRYFADKPEVLFIGGHVLEAELVKSVAQAPGSAGPLDAIASALQSVAAGFFAGRQEFSRQRQQVIESSSDLQERELLKLASLAAALAAALRDRGAAEPAASLAAEAGVAVFKTAFARWVSEGSTADLASIVAVTVADLRAIVTGG